MDTRRRILATIRQHKPEISHARKPKRRTNRPHNRPRRENYPRSPIELQLINRNRLTRPQSLLRSRPLRLPIGRTAKRRRPNGLHPIKQLPAKQIICLCILPRYIPSTIRNMAEPHQTRHGRVDHGPPMNSYKPHVCSQPTEILQHALTTTHIPTGLSPKQYGEYTKET